MHKTKIEHNHPPIEHPNPGYSKGKGIIHLCRAIAVDLVFYERRPKKLRKLGYEIRI